MCMQRKAGAKHLSYSLHESLPPPPGFYIPHFLSPPQVSSLEIKSDYVQWFYSTCYIDGPPPGPPGPHNPLLLPADGERGKKKIKAGGKNKASGKTNISPVSWHLTLSLTLACGRNKMYDLLGVSCVTQQ